MKKPTWRHWVNRLFTPICPGCQQPLKDQTLCLVCQSFLPALTLACPTCGEPDSNGHKCGYCLKHPARWDQLYVPWSFEFLARHLILQFKYHKNFSAGLALTEHWQEQTRAFILPDAFIAVPMTANKEIRRSYNQAHWIAKQFSKQHKVPIFTGLDKIIDTKPLEGLNKRQRRQTLKGAFRLSLPPPAHVALVDDVFTSGATVGELARLLKKAGVQRVDVWVLARTPLKRLQ